jgi:hypothetical protein
MQWVTVILGCRRILGRGKVIGNLGSRMLGLAEM